MLKSLTYYTQAQAATILGVSRQRVHQLVRRGDLGTATVHGRRMIYGPSLYAFIARRNKDTPNA